MSTDGVLLIIHTYALCRSNHKAFIIPGAIAVASVFNTFLGGNFNFPHSLQARILVLDDINNTPTGLAQQ